jgi:hypothetical protein
MLLAIEKTRTIGCPNPSLFYKLEGLLPGVYSRKQVPSDFLADERHYENP